MLKILTLNWNGRDKLEKLRQSLMPSLEGMDYQWWIKDNGSSDDSISLIKGWNDLNIIGVKYPHNRDNFAHGCNFLFKESAPSSEDLILLLNNDIIFEDAISIKKMIDILTRDDQVGLVGAKLKYTNSNKIQHNGIVFEPQLTMPVHFMARRDDSLEASKNREFQAVTGAVWLTKAKYYENISCDPVTKLKGLDHRMSWAFDDVWGSLAIKHDMKKKVVCCGATNIFHEESASLKKNPVNKLFMLHNITQFKKRWSGVYKIDKMLYQDLNYNLYKGV